MQTKCKIFEIFSLPIPHEDTVFDFFPRNGNPAVAHTSMGIVRSLRAAIVNARRMNK